MGGCLDKVALIPVDWLRHMVSGWSPEDETLLAARNAGALARNFCDQGLQVIIDGPYAEPQAVDTLRAEVHPARVVAVTLWATWQAVVSRHEARPPNNRADLERVRSIFQRVEASRGAVEGPWIDTSTMTPEEVRDAILEVI